MELIILAILTLVLGAASYGSCNRMHLNNKIEHSKEPSIYDIDRLLSSANPKNIGASIDKYSNLLYWSFIEKDVLNYIYSFDRKSPVIEQLFLTIPILSVWLYCDKGYSLYDLQVSAAIYLPFVAGWFLSKLLIFGSYSEDNRTPTQRTPFPFDGGYEAFEEFLDKEIRRISIITRSRFETMKRQQKEISRCNSIRIAVTTLAIAIGIMTWNNV